MGLLVSIRESWAEFLRSNTEGEDGGPAAFFGAAPAIPIYTEKLKTISQAITDAQTKIGLNIVIVTVTAREAQAQHPGELWFGKIAVVARVMENPKINHTGVCASDCAEAVAWYSKRFQLGGGFPLMFREIALAPHEGSLVYDVVFTLEAGTPTAPSRTPITQP